MTIQTEITETSLSKLSDHDWAVLQNRWARGASWNVEKIGRKWSIAFGGFPLFTTKTAAYDAGANLICLEARARWLRREAA